MHNRHHISSIPRCWASLVPAIVLFLASTTTHSTGAQEPPRPFRFPSDSIIPPPFEFPLPSAPSGVPPPRRTNNSTLAWQPLPLRATFRPLNRQTGQTQPQPPLPPVPPSPPAAPSLPSALETSASLNLIGDSTNSQPAVNSEFPLPSSRRSIASNLLNSLAPVPRATSTTTPRPLGPTTTDSFSFSDSNNNDDELPTRQPLSRFRPTRAPSDDEDSPVPLAPGAATSNGLSASISPPPSTLFNFNSSAATTNNNSQQPPALVSRITSECYECICEASTSCNVNSRCQTSDVRHTRCGMFLISYDQWVSTELSREQVTREQLARDPAADERAFYECATQRDCAERLLAIYLERNSKDCDKDGRIDCFDLAAIHHSGMEQCASEALLESQYWNDFNACFGFGRRRRRRRR